MLASSPGLSSDFFVTWTEFISVPYRSPDLPDIKESGYFCWFLPFLKKKCLDTMYIRCFIIIFIKRVTSFHSQEKCFELNFWTVKPGGNPVMKPLVHETFLWLNQWNSTFNNIVKDKKVFEKVWCQYFWLASRCMLCWKNVSTKQCKSSKYQSLIF